MTVLIWGLLTFTRARNRADRYVRVIVDGGWICRSGSLFDTQRAEPQFLVGIDQGPNPHQPRAAQL